MGSISFGLIRSLDTAVTHTTETFNALGDSLVRKRAFLKVTFAQKSILSAREHLLFSHVPDHRGLAESPATKALLYKVL